MQPMDQSLMSLLLRAFYWFEEALQRHMKARGWEKLPRSQSVALVNITLGVRRSSELARNLGVSRQAMSQIVQELQAKGFITLHPDPSDGRAHIIGPNERSVRNREDAQSIMAVLEVELARRLGKEQVATLRRALSADWGDIPSPEALPSDPTEIVNVT
jgi:DNA-binding MarR family transcriptional regulator